MKQGLAHWKGALLAKNKFVSIIQSPFHPGVRPGTSMKCKITEWVRILVAESEFTHSVRKSLIQNMGNRKYIRHNHCSTQSYGFYIGNYKKLALIMAGLALDARKWPPLPTHVLPACSHWYYQHTLTTKRNTASQAALYASITVTTRKHQACPNKHTASPSQPQLPPPQQCSHLHSSQCHL